MSATNSQLPECDLDVTDSLPTVEALADRYATLTAARVRELRTRKITATRFSRFAHRSLAWFGQGLWFLEAHLQTQS